MATRAIEMQCGRIELISPHPTMGSILTSSDTFLGEDLLSYTGLDNTNKDALYSSDDVIGSHSGINVNYYIVGINQFTGQRYTEAWDGETLATTFGSDWDEGYYRVHVKLIGTDNDKDIEINLEKKPLYWNKSFISWMLWMPAGSYWMGSPADEPGHQSNELLKRVTLTSGFYIARTLCTQAMYNYIMTNTNTVTSLTARNSVAFSYYDYLGRRYMSSAWHYKDDAEVTVPDATDSNMFLYKSEGRNAPTSEYPDGQVVDITHDGVIDKLNVDHAVTKDGVSYVWRPPYEAEWEYACRAGVKTSLTDGKILRQTGDLFYADLDRLAWYKGNSSGTKTVAMKYPNLVGLYDMLGNLYEWNYDYIHSFSNGSPQTDPWGATRHSNRSLRGGNWSNTATACRCARRSSNYVSLTSANYGFRLALVASPSN